MSQDHPENTHEKPTACNLQRFQLTLQVAALRWAQPLCFLAARLVQPVVQAVITRCPLLCVEKEAKREVRKTKSRHRGRRMTHASGS